MPNEINKDDLLVIVRVLEQLAEAMDILAERINRLEEKANETESA